MPGAGVVLRGPSAGAAEPGRQVPAGHAGGGSREGCTPAGAGTGLHGTWGVGARRAARLGRTGVRRRGALRRACRWSVLHHTIFGFRSMNIRPLQFRSVRLSVCLSIGLSVCGLEPSRLLGRQICKLA